MHEHHNILIVELKVIYFLKFEKSESAPLGLFQFQKICLSIIYMTHNQIK